MKISVIIPIYNGEEYLEQCIGSVLNQTIEELEIICVDDGSTDHSAEIICNFAQKDTRIVLLQQDNQGPGSARNAGIQRALGEYIAFLDADDFYLNPDALLQMYSTCKEKNASVCASRKLCMKFVENRIIELFEDGSQKKVLSYKDYQMDYFYQSYLFQRKMLTENHLYFPDYRRYQDPPFFVRALYCAESFVIADTCLYCYRVSDSMPKFNTLKTIDLLKGVIDNLEFAEKNDLNILFQRTALRLENDFTNIIYDNISVQDIKILELLIKANQIIEKKYGYIIKPVKMILFSKKRYEKQLLEKIVREGSLAVYGAGKYARLFLKFMRKYGLSERVTNIVVTDLKENDSSLDGIFIISLDEFLKGKHRCLFVAAGENNQREIRRNLEKKKYENFEIIEELFLSCLEKDFAAIKRN